MTVVDEFEGTGSADMHAARDAPGSSDRRQGRVLVSPFLLLALVLLVATAWGLLVLIRNATEPQAFSKFSVGTSGSSAPGKPGVRYTFGVTHGRLPDVTVQSARSVLTKGSAAAATTVSICRARPHQDGIGAWAGDVSEFCSEVIPIDGQDLGQLGPHDTIIATVVPLTDGSVHMTGVHLEYRQGMREASETITISLRVDGAD